MAENETEAPESLKVKLAHPRRIRPFGQRKIRIFERGSVVELERVDALSMCAGGLAEAVSEDTKTAKGRALDEAPKASKESKPDK